MTTIDLKTGPGRELAREIVARSDVVVENFRPGVMERLGLGWKDVHRINPAAVMLSLSTYGQTGPDASRPGYAPVSLGMQAALPHLDLLAPGADLAAIERVLPALLHALR